MCQGCEEIAYSDLGVAVLDDGSRDDTPLRPERSDF
jgi:hypothetical protein